MTRTSLLLVTLLINTTNGCSWTSNLAEPDAHHEAIIGSTSAPAGARFSNPPGESENVPASALAQAAPRVVIVSEMTNKDLNMAELQAFDRIASKSRKMSRR